jgi:cob(I)alamin adenosyltransferase
MKIYTKRGDEGFTDLFGGERVPKNHLRVKATGAVDGACAAIGLAHSAVPENASLRNDLERIMKLLFCAGAEIACAQKERAHELLEKWLKNHIEDRHITWMEEAIDAQEAHLTPLRNFILPCGSDGAARLHYARICVRHAEIALIDLKGLGEDVRPEIMKFFNRLSDFLFVLARIANKNANTPDITWSGNISDC